MDANLERGRGDEKGEVRKERLAKIRRERERGVYLIKLVGGNNLDGLLQEDLLSLVLEGALDVRK